ncbi:RNA polymerase sigma factor [soil metagenome]
MTAKSMLMKATDETLLSQYQKGDRDAMGVLYQRYFSKVYQWCFLCCRNPDDAYDLAQDSLLKAFDQAHTFRHESSFSTWVSVITKNNCRTFLNRMRRRNISRLDDVSASQERIPIHMLETYTVQEEKEVIMLSLLDQISKEERHLLYLKYYMGESILTIQAQFNLSASAVKMRLKRSREKLNAQYTSHLSAA